MTCCLHLSDGTFEDPRVCAREAFTAAWHHCVTWGQTAPGSHDDWCKSDFGPAFKHVGRQKAACPPGFGKGVCSDMGLGPPFAPLENSVASLSSLHRQNPSPPHICFGITAYLVSNQAA
jgi:hypothetical protein